MPITLPAPAEVTPELGPGRKTVYALGDVSLNTALSAMTLVYATYFLTQYAELRPVLAGLIPLVGRAVDAVSDPLMGRISDHTSWRAGRRRPYFLIGALPFGLFFALLWLDPPLDSQVARFSYYMAIYCLFSLSMTLLSVPYLAIQPEMAVDYDARTSLNTYRSVGALIGVAAAVLIRPLAYSFGGGSAGFAAAGITYGALLTLPWLAVYSATFERPEFRTRRSDVGWIRGIRGALTHRTFVQLTSLYIMGRMAMDIAAALIILYVTHWLERPQDFELVMFLFLGSAVLALPMWLRVAQGRDKASVFIVGSLWWMVTSLVLAFIQPSWPNWLVFVFVPIVGMGYAVVDLMPWSMVGEVIDEDDLQTGERREGLYNGLFTFVRKLGGALGVFLVMAILDLAGYQKGDEQTETARQTVRWLTAGGPAVLLALAVWLARGYPLNREAHQRILAALARRDTEQT